MFTSEHHHASADGSIAAWLVQTYESEELVTAPTTTERDWLRQWPAIRCGLRADVTGEPVDDFAGWEARVRTDKNMTAGQVADGYEQWAAYYAWQEQRAHELHADASLRRRLVAQRLDSLAHSCRRTAAVLRGENPGPCLAQFIRRPDLAASMTTRPTRPAAGSGPHSSRKK